MHSEDRAVSVSLAGTLHRTNARSRRNGVLLVLLGLLLLGRAVVYRLLAPASSWTPRLNLHFIIPAFPNESFVALLAFSVLSFLRILSVPYLWAFTLLAVNRRSGDGNRLQKALRLHLGLAGRLPWILQLVIPLVAVASAWIVLAPFLAFLGVNSRIPALPALTRQGCLIGGALYLSLKYILPALLLAHLILSYVFFGRSTVCEFINLTAGNLLVPLRWLPLKLGRVDFSPVVGAALVLLVLHIIPIHVLPWAEQYWRIRLHPIWPY